MTRVSHFVHELAIALAESLETPLECATTHAEALGHVIQAGIASAQLLGDRRAHIAGKPPRRGQTFEQQRSVIVQTAKMYSA